MAITDRFQGYTIGVAVKPPCTVASTANLALSSSQVIDGIAVGSCERVLVKDQTNPKDNGIYLAGEASWRRAADFDGKKDAIPGTQVYVDRGNIFGRVFFAANSSSTAISIDIGSTGDDVTWSQITPSLTDVSAGTVLAAGSLVERPLDERFADVIWVDDYGTNGVAIQAAMDENPIATVMMGDRTYVSTAVITKPSGCSFRGVSVNSVIQAGAGFPLTHTVDSKTFDAPILYCDNSSGSKITDSGLFKIDGNSNAPTGIVYTNGANHRLSDVRTENTTVQAYVFDGCQNHTFTKLLTNIPGNRGYYIINGTYNCTFIACDSNKASSAELLSENSSDYPSFGVFSGVDGMTECTWIGGIMERAVTTKDRVVHLVEGSFNTFVGGQFTAAEATVCAVETSTATNHNVFLNTRFFGNGVEVPAIIDRGFRNTYLHPSISLFGTATLNDLIEVYNQCNIIDPFFTNININGKHIVNKSGSTASSFNIHYETYKSVGNTAQRPDELIDTGLRYIDTSLKKGIWYDIGSTAWRAHDGFLADGSTYADGDMTPDVAGVRDLFEITNSSATIITDFANGEPGQSLPIVFKNGNTTIAVSSAIVLNSTVNFAASTHDTLTLVKERTFPSAWVETGRSVNST